MKTRIVIYIPVYNSFGNLNSIISSLKLLKNFSIEVVIIDNSSVTLNDNKKILNITKLKSRYRFINFTLIINKKNYGLGGSFKIMLQFINYKKYDCLLVLQSSGRFNPSEVLKKICNNFSNNFDYIVFSRFLKLKYAKKYSYLRLMTNLIFIKLTEILTKCRASDFGTATYFIKTSVIKKINYKNITNGSHFPHFFRIYLENLNLNKIEIPYRWSEGNIKSHLKPYLYVPVLFISLIKYFFTNSFLFEDNNNFKYIKYKF
jgi:hypothetical protein